MPGLRPDSMVARKGTWKQQRNGVWEIRQTHNFLRRFLRPLVLLHSPRLPVQALSCILAQM
eukprot:1160293-Pelagomonas_calceolata.AAC.8